MASACARTRRPCARWSRARSSGWPDGEPFALHPRMQAITLEVILRAVFGVTDPARRAQLAGRPRAAAGRHLVVARAVRRAAVPPLRRPRSARRPGGAAAGDRRDARRGDRRAPRRPARGHPLPVRDRPLRGRRADGRPGGPRPADDAAACGSRDDRDRPGVDVRPAAAPPARARAPGRGGRRRGGGLRARRGVGVAAAAPGRAAGRPPPQPGAARQRPRAAARHRRHARDLARPHAPGPLPRALRVPPRALPRARAGDLRLGPVRRRRAALPRGGVRGDGDAGRADRDPAAADAAAGLRRRPSGSRGATSPSRPAPEHG